MINQRDEVGEVYLTPMVEQTLSVVAWSERTTKTLGPDFLTQDPSSKTNTCCLLLG